MKHNYQGLVNGTISVVYNGRTFQESGHIRLEDKKLINKLKGKYKIIGTVCNITKRKGLHQVIKALPLLPEAAFIIIGSGKGLEELVKLARKLNVMDRCHFLGERLEVSAYLNTFDLFAMTSYSEGLPLALLEAASCGVPSICSDIPMLREIFSQEEVAFFSLDDTDSFLNAYKIITNDSSYSIRIREKYLAAYTGQNMADCYLQLYQQLLGVV
jgi:glycosyltransferase involved in cell wall biosynthesis